MSPREALGKGVDAFFSDIKSQESEVMSQELGGETRDSKVTTKKSRVRTKKPLVKSHDSTVISDESIVSTNESEVRTQNSEVITQESEVKTIDSGVLTQAITEARENPRISLWSPLVMSVLRYKQLTTYRFSMSREASKVLEEAFREEYPELCERIEQEGRGQS